MDADKGVDAALARLAIRGLAYVAIRGDRGAIVGGGSGTTWRTRSGSTLLLTAKHFVTGHRSFSVGSPTGVDERIRDAAVVEHPILDLATLKLSEPRFFDVALDEAVIADDATTAKGTNVIVAGFPDQLSFTDRDHLGEVLLKGTTTYFTRVAGADNDHISIEWKESESDEDAARPFARVGIRAGRQFLKKPVGISGGAAWRLMKAKPNEIWSPSRNLHVIGVPVAFSAKRELAVPAWRWRSWLTDQLS